MFGLFALSAGLAAAGVVEGTRHRAALRAVPIRIHVNGTRGKSTVTRLVTAALQSAALRTLGKVTGTAPRWLLPDGSEERVRRPFGVARIHEQSAALRRAAELGCTALVVECMAIHPELQWVSEHRMLHSTIGVITNARHDHAAAMGTDLRTVARTLANTVPERTVLVYGDPAIREVVEPVARGLGTRLVLAGAVNLGDIPADLRDGVAWHHPVNLGIALQVADLLEIDRLTTWRGLAEAGADPGTARYAHAQMPDGRPVVILDATAANDPESVALIVAAVRNLAGNLGPSHVVYHHRSDRMDRLARFGEFLAAMRPSSLWCSGDTAGAGLLSRLTGCAAAPSLTPGGALLMLGVKRWTPEGPTTRKPAELVVVCGNTRGARAWQQPFGPWIPVPLGEGRDRR